MTTLDLDTLVRCGFPVQRIAHQLLRHPRPVLPDTYALSEAEHAYLLAHLEALPIHLLDAWIRLRPPTHAATILEAYVARNDACGWSAFDVSTPPSGWHPDDVAELCDLLHQREQARSHTTDLSPDPATMWRRWLPTLTGFAALYHRLVAYELSPAMASLQRAAALRLWEGEAPLAARLWPLRRDERGLERQLVALTCELTTTYPRAAPYAWTCLDKLGLLTKIEHPSAVLPSDLVWPEHPVPPPSEEPAPPEDGSGRRFVRLHTSAAPLSEQESEGEFFRHLALRWPEPGHAEASDWLVHQALRAVQNGTPWSVIWSAVTEPEMRARLGLASLEMPTPALFAGWALTTRIGKDEPFPWEAFFAWCERDPRALAPLESLFQEAFTFPDALERTAKDSGALRRELAPCLCAEQVLLQASLPTDLDACFVERFWRTMRTLHARSPFPLWPTDWIARLLTLPLAQAQARVLLEDVVAWPREDTQGYLARLVALAGPLPAAQCALDKILYRPWVSDPIELYRLLVGPDADEALCTWMARELDEAVQGRSGSHRAFALLRQHPELHTDELREAMRAYVRSGPYGFARQMHAEEPWLIDEDELAQVALRQASTEREWEHDLALYPASCLPALKAQFCRLLRGWDETPLARLEAWLDEHGVTRDELIALWFDQGAEVRQAQGGVRWLVTILSTGSGWKDHGRLVVTRALEAGCPGLLVGIAWELMLRPVPPPANAPPSTTPAGPPLAAIHEALARVLVERIGHTLEKTHEDPSDLLRALFFLSPRAAIARSFHALRKKPRSQNFAMLMDACGQHLRHSNPSDASLEDLRMAVTELLPRPAGDEASAEPRPNA